MTGPCAFLAYLLPDPEHSAVTRSLLVVGYAAASLGWLRAGQQARLVSAANSFARWWFIGAVLLFLLAVNKLFNLRGLFENGFRALAKAGNWYDRRQTMQFVLAVVLPSVLAIFVAVVLATKGRAFVCCHRLALVGWLLLLLYLALRQTQEWKPILPWLRSIRYYDWRLALEMTGMLLVTLAALIEDLPPPADPSTKERV